MREIYGDELFERLRPDWSSAQAAQVDAWFNDPQTSSWVAELDSVTVGFIVTTCDQSTGMGMLEIIAVHPDQQRQGIGARLISHALAHLRDAGVAYVEAYIRDFAGHAPAHQALRSQGFTRRAVMPVLLYRATEFPGSPAHRPARIRRITEADVDACVTFGVEAFRSVYASFEDLYGPDLFGRFEPDWEATQASYIRRRHRPPRSRSGPARAGHRPDAQPLCVRTKPRGVDVIRRRRNSRRPRTRPRAPIVRERRFRADADPVEPADHPPLIDRRPARQRRRHYAPARKPRRRARP